MASTWLDSWGNSWGDSWGQVTVDPNAMRGVAHGSSTAAGTLSSVGGGFISGSASGTSDGSGTLGFTGEDSQLVSAAWLFWSSHSKKKRNDEEREIEEVVSEVVHDAIMEIANRTDIPPVAQVIAKAKQLAKDKDYYQSLKVEVSPTVIRDVQKQVAQEVRQLVAQAEAYAREQEDEERAIIEMMMELM